MFLVTLVRIIFLSLALIFMSRFVPNTGTQLLDYICAGIFVALYVVLTNMHMEFLRNLNNDNEKRDN